MLKIYFDAIKSFAQFYSIIFLINIIFSAAVVFFQRKKPTSTLLWVMAINFLPIVGIILYLLIGQDVSKSKMFDSKTQADRITKNKYRDTIENIQSREYKSSNAKTKEYKEIVEK